MINATWGHIGLPDFFQDDRCGGAANEVRARILRTAYSAATGFISKTRDIRAAALKSPQPQSE